MNKSIIAGAALFAGIAIASPMLAATPAESEQQLAQAGPDRPAGMPGMMGGMHGMMGEHPEMGMRHHGWMHEGMMRRSPRERCEERIARRAGRIAYTVAKLNLNLDQRQQWDKVQGVLQTAGDRERQLCASLKPAGEREQETVLDRLGRREQFLTTRLQTVQQIRPALEQFYQTLTPEQKATINHPFR